MDFFKQSPFFQQAHLLVRLLPIVSKEKCFALKGGTAINLFLRDVPRISVDIDLTYLSFEPRKNALQGIHEALVRISKAIKSQIGTSQVREVSGSEHLIYKLFVENKGVKVKIEPNTVLRGNIFPCEETTLSKKAQEIFEMSATMSLMSTAEVYGGKLCAALDRQHPRDLFDVKILMENEGLSSKIRQAFVIYLATHKRPVNELLRPSLVNIDSIFNREFSGMPLVPVALEELTSIQLDLAKTMQEVLTLAEKKFLLSLKKATPDWSLIDSPHLQRLPAIQWKLLNIQNMSKDKRQMMEEKLRVVLGL